MKVYKVNGKLATEQDVLLARARALLGEEVVERVIYSGERDGEHLPEYMVLVEIETRPPVEAGGQPVLWGPIEIDAPTCHGCGSMMVRSDGSTLCINCGVRGS